MIIGTNYTTYSTPSFRGPSPKSSSESLKRLARQVKERPPEGDTFDLSSSVDKPKHYIETKDGSLFQIGLGSPSGEGKKLLPSKSIPDFLKEKAALEKAKATERQKAVKLGLGGSPSSNESALPEELELLQLENLKDIQQARAEKLEREMNDSRRRKQEGEYDKPQQDPETTKPLPQIPEEEKLSKRLLKKVSNKLRSSNSGKINKDT